ncbi:hypothetical protein EDB84DRAFT_1472688, partial [Lactarius hengduanensis]
MKVSQEREHSCVPHLTRPRAHNLEMAVVSSLATGGSVALPNARISSSHCSLSASSSSLDDWVELMRRLFIRNRNGENWSQTWAIEDNCQSNCLHDIHGNGLSGYLNLCLTERRQYSYPLNESAKFRSVHRGLEEECDINIPENRCIDSGHETVQVLASSSIFEEHESGENNP